MTNISLLPFRKYRRYSFSYIMRYADYFDSIDAIERPYGKCSVVNTYRYQYVFLIKGDKYLLIEKQRLDGKKK